MGLWVQVFQRQLSKEGLQQVVNNNAAAASAGSDAGDGAGGGIAAALMSAEDLRNLFTLRLHTASDTFDSMCNDDSDEAEDDEQNGNDAAEAPPAAAINKEQVSQAFCSPRRSLLHG